MLFGPDARRLDLTIDVVDAKSGKPVPNAVLVISTWSYGPTDNNPRTFLVPADKDGWLSFKQPIDYAISHVGVRAWNEPMTKTGVDWATTYAVTPWAHLLGQMRSWDQTKFVWFNPNHGHFHIELTEVSGDDREQLLRQHKAAVLRSNKTMHWLSEAGVQISR